MDSDVYEKIKKLTLEEFANILTTFVDIKKDNQKKDCKKTVVNNKTLYNIDELIDNYPFFTRYSINKAIQNDGLPYMIIGKKRLFDKDAIDAWITKENDNKKTNKNKYNF